MSWRPLLTVAPPQGQSHRCPTCSGTGGDEYDCPRCFGSGQVCAVCDNTGITPDGGICSCGAFYAWGEYLERMWTPAGITQISYDPTYYQHPPVDPERDVWLGRLRHAAQDPRYIAEMSEHPRWQYTRPRLFILEDTPEDLAAWRYWTYIRGDDNLRRRNALTPFLWFFPGAGREVDNDLLTVVRMIASRSTWHRPVIVLARVVPEDFSERFSKDALRRRFAKLYAATAPYTWWLPAKSLTGETWVSDMGTALKQYSPFLAFAPQQQPDPELNQ